MKANWAPSDWQILPIGDVVNPVRKPVAVNQTTSYREIGIRSHGKGIFYKEEITGEALGDKRVFWVEPDCLVVNIVFAWEGAVAQTTKAESGMIASHRFPMYKPIAEILDLDFLTYFFRSKRGIHLLQLASPGGAGRNKTLGQQEFLQLEIPLPSLSEQQKIAAILRTNDDAISLAEQLITAKQRRKQALMQQLLTGKVRFPEFKSHWEQATLEQVCVRFVNGGTPSTDKDEYWDGDIPWITGADIINQKITSVRDHVTKAGVKNSATNVIEKGNLLIVTRTGVGKLAIAPFDLAISQDLTGVYVNSEKIDVCFLFHSLNFRVPLLTRLNQGTSINGITRKTLVGFEVLVPSLKEQQKIASIFQILDQELDLLQQKLTALRQQKQGLMQQLLTGKIRVKG